MARREKVNPRAAFPCFVETFREPSAYTRYGLVSDKPSCANSNVSIRRYRIIFELIDEPVEVLCERLQALWDMSDNYHDHDALVREAKMLGYELRGTRGSKVTTRRGW